MIPKLQDLPVISVSLGDWHIVALTADGRVLSWGNDMQGTLGLGDSMAEQRVTSPQEVQPFGVGPSKVFCVGVTAMGWHTAVLAVDLEVRYYSNWSCYGLRIFRRILAVTAMMSKS